MPGIHCFYSSNNISPETVKRSHEGLLFREGYELLNAYADKKCDITVSRYTGYPLLLIDESGYKILLEGMVYNQSHDWIVNSLHSICESYLNGKDHISKIAGFVEECDGEFLTLILFQETKDLIIFNDRWARLPVHYSQFENAFALSREIKYILPFMPAIEFDRNWMAEFLIFEYNLGNKCLIKNIRSMRPAELLVVQNKDANLRLKQHMLHPCSFNVLNPELNRNDIIERCVGYFKQSLKQRVEKIIQDNYGIVVDVSGGHDTRAVFAGLNNLEVNMTACNDHLTEGVEAEIAGKVAGLYNQNLIRFKGERPVDNISKLAEITYYTDCQVNCMTAAIGYYDEMERAKSIFGKQAHFMGLGGEFLRHRYRPIKHYPGLFEMIMDNGFTNIFSVKDACSLVNLSFDEFADNIRSELNGFGESDVTGQAIHLNFERYNKFDNGGENRHRLFNWVVSPFWGKELFELVTLKVPPSIFDYVFFADFLKALDPKSAQIPIYAGIMGINSLNKYSLFNIKVKLKNLIRYNRYLNKSAGYLLKKYSRSKINKERQYNLLKTAIDIGGDCRPISDIFNLSRLKMMYSAPPGELELYQILTLVFYVKEVEKRFSKKVKL